MNTEAEFTWMISAKRTQIKEITEMATSEDFKPKDGLENQTMK